MEACVQVVAADAGMLKASGVTLRVAAIVLVFSLAASAKCFAICLIFPCTAEVSNGTSLPTRNSPCHHNTPTDGSRHTSSSCGRQSFITADATDIKAPDLQASALSALLPIADYTSPGQAAPPENPLRHPPPRGNHPPSPIPLRI